MPLSHYYEYEYAPKSLTFKENAYPSLFNRMNLGWSVFSLSPYRAPLSLDITAIALEAISIKIKIHIGCVEYAIRNGGTSKVARIITSIGKSVKGLSRVGVEQ
jgi:hypothetical protein